MNGLRCMVVGAGGMVGGELLRLLSMHPRIGEITALSRSQAGKKAHQVHHGLLHLTAIEMRDQPIEEAVQSTDVVFFALPHGESQTLMPQVIDASPEAIVDLAADFRIRDPEVFKRYYGDHCCPELIRNFTYGLPEAFPDRSARGRFVANPGCFATAAELSLFPLAVEKLLSGRTAIYAVTGSSGSGRNPSPTTHHPFRDGNFYAYKMLAHQHEAEIDQFLSEAAEATQYARLLTHSGPFIRGIHATTFIRDERFEELDIRELYRTFYDDRRPFVTVLNRPPLVAEVAATNYVHLFVEQKGCEVEIVLALDNLVKGAAGQAIQNMNLVLGFPETEGLDYPGVFTC
jgi:N-acetyl-gamma-glutamyl-phosphate reductase common form